MAKDTKAYKIFGEVDEIQSNYENSSREKVSGLYRSQHKVIQMCEYYSDSRYVGFFKDNKDPYTGRPVPFYNIVNYRVALAKTATDLDVKDIQIVADNPKYAIHSMLLNREVYEWMKKVEFARTLNTMGQTRPKYGGYLVKKTEIDGELNIEVMKWSNVWTDQTDILGAPIVEKHYLTPVELMKKQDSWENIKDVLKAYRGIKSKDRPTTIDILEVTGEFPKEVIKDAYGEKITEKDSYEYSLQKYFLADVDGKKFVLFSEEIGGKMEDYFDYLSWEDNGYALGRGVIEDSEEAQVWTNDAVIEEMLAMKLAGKAGILTDDDSLGNSVLEHDHGKIYNMKPGKTAQAFNIVPSALGQYQTQIEKWKNQADNVTSSFNSLTGEQPPSGTPYSQTALLNQVGSKPFDYKREEWGIHLTKMFDKWVIPFVIKKIRKEHILVSDFSENELQAIDEAFAIYQTNQDTFNELMKGNVVSPFQQQAAMDEYKGMMKKNGKKRYIKIPAKFFDEVECKVTVVTTGEQKNKAAILQTLSTMLGDVTNLYQLGIIKDTSFLEQILKEIIENSSAGISSASFGKLSPVDMMAKPTAQNSSPAPKQTAQPAITT